MSSNRQPYLTQVDPSAANNGYYPLAQELITAMLQRFPKGSVNQVKVVKELKLTTPQLTKYLETLGSFGTKMEQMTLRTPPSFAQEFADLIQHLDAANCGLFASYAIGYLKYHHPKIPAEVVYLDGHALIVFGQSTCDKKALFCDPWTREIYHAQKLDKVRSSSANLAVYNRVHDHFNRTVEIRLRKDEHHLQGKPEVYTTPASKHIDAIFGLMVAEDERRQKLAQKKNKQHEAKEEMRNIKAPLSWSYAADLSNLIFKAPEQRVKIFDLQRQTPQGDLIFHPEEEAKPTLQI